MVRFEVASIFAVVGISGKAISGAVLLLPPVGPVTATRMACSADVMMREAALVTALENALENARTYQRARIRLVLFDMDGIPILELRQTDWD